MATVRVERWQKVVAQHYLHDSKDAVGAVGRLGIMREPAQRIYLIVLNLNNTVAHSINCC